ncbi:uncharacterized protein LOC124690850 [Lolium rigidum]|uniref:uncharacterized protein LOC124690850 n=1 Tax=Lolium rigidum TaxID=89674 RepID=UPI001F5CF4FB|nr:uncharacterized protein LOC124690850 [Lolium rigidum]
MGGCWRCWQMDEGLAGWMRGWLFQDSIWYQCRFFDFSDFSHYVPPEYGDYLYDAGNSEGNSFSSGNDDMEYQTRDMLLDDALFGFFRKQAVKSLKRNFSDFCRDFSPSTNVNRSEVDGVDRAAFHRNFLVFGVVFTLAFP